MTRATTRLSLDQLERARPGFCAGKPVFQQLIGQRSSLEDEASVPDWKPKWITRVGGMGQYKIVP